MVLQGSGSQAGQRGLRALPPSTLLLLLLLDCCCRCTAAGPSLSSCGGTDDLLKDAKFTVSPDPIAKESPFTITASGTLGAALSSGSVSVDLEAKVLALGHPLVDKTIQKTVPFSVTPGVPMGDTQLVIGPVSLPAHVPGSADITGKIVVKDSKAAQVTCIDMDFHFAMLAATLAPARSSSASAQSLRGEASCGKPGDHLSNITASRSSGGFEGGGMLDEDLTRMTFDADLKLHVGFLPVPVKLEIPVAFSPGLKRGEVWAKVGPAEDHAAAWPERSSSIGVTGEVTWNDASKQEIACMSLSEDGSGAAAATVVV